MGFALDFRGRVAVVTGAGTGLGKSHALEFARRGAKVVVNDLGGDALGAGQDKAPADAVVEEIRAGGGDAVVSYDSVEDGVAIIQGAIDQFGRLDVLVNNAGVLRDKSFAKMSEDDWDLVYRVHSLGVFRVTKAAWPHLKAQRYGRIITTASAAGIYGNFGQANYAAAKLGLYGLTQTLALEGAKHGVFVNCIAPLAGTRLMETVMPPPLAAALKPEFVTALVVKLCAETSTQTGGLFEVGAGWVAKLRWERSRGVAFEGGRGGSAEDVDAAWPEIVNFTNAEHPSCVADSFAKALSNLGLTWSPPTGSDGAS